MERRDGTGTTDLSTGMPQWAVVTIAIVICLAFVIAVMIAVGAIGHCCVCSQTASELSSRTIGRVPRCPWRSRQRSWGLFPHRLMVADNRRRPTVQDYQSVDTITLATVRPPPPVYIHPPGYHSLSKTASATEQGVSEGHTGVVL